MEKAPMTFDMADYVATLMRLGFSHNQAKVYLALTTLGATSVNDVMKLSGVPREEVYRKLQELQKLGLVERIFAKPLLFRAEPLEYVTTTRLKLKAEELAKLQIKTEEMLRDFKETKKNEKMKAGKSEIILIPEQKPLWERTKREMDKLKISLDTVCSWKKGIEWISSLHDLFVELLKKKVKIRFILGKTEPKFPRFVEELQNNPLFQIKTSQALPPASVSLYDRKICLIDTSTITSFIESPVLWSNNPSIVGMAQIYFDTEWTNS
jgi:sugar-specific transcriptional regulator TrmB